MLAMLLKSTYMAEIASFPLHPLGVDSPSLAERIATPNRIYISQPLLQIDLACD